MCGLTQRVSTLPRGYKAECVRCGETVLRDQPRSRSLTAAFTLAALFLYVPANIYPILTMEYVGQHTESTVWDGVVGLTEHNLWAIAIIVFAASMVIPLLKLLGLFFLVATRGPRWRKGRTHIHKWITKLGPWAMLDVFLLAVMVAVIRFGKVATVIPGPGIYAFTSVVVLTLLASASFNSQLIWKEEIL